jgi:membrane protein implicated in regulation of membrane protease activity
MSALSAEQTRRRGTLAKYVMLQIPGFVLVSGGLGLSIWLFDFETSVAGGLLALWVVKDALMYPIVRVGYEHADPDATQHLVGAIGVAQAPFDAEGWIKVGSELWRAQLARGAPPVEAGAALRVVEVRGLTLRVEAA